MRHVIYSSLMVAFLWGYAGGLLAGDGVFVSNMRGKATHFELHPDQTRVQELVERVAAAEQADPKNIVMVFNGKRLEDNKLLIEHGIVRDSRLVWMTRLGLEQAAVAPAWDETIYVHSSTGKVSPLTFPTLNGVRVREIHGRLGTTDKDTRYMYAGRALPVDSLITDLGIENGTHIFQVLKLRGS